MANHVQMSGLPITLSTLFKTERVHIQRTDKSWKKNCMSRRKKCGRKGKVSRRPRCVISAIEKQRYILSFQSSSRIVHTFCFFFLLMWDLWMCGRVWFVFADDKRVPFPSRFSLTSWLDPRYATFMGCVTYTSCCYNLNLVLLSTCTVVKVSVKLLFFFSHLNRNFVQRKKIENHNLLFFWSN